MRRVYTKRLNAPVHGFAQVHGLNDKKTKSPAKNNHKQPTLKLLIIIIIIIIIIIVIIIIIIITIIIITIIIITIIITIITNIKYQVQISLKLEKYQLLKDEIASLAHAKSHCSTSC